MEGHLLGPKKGDLDNYLYSMKVIGQNKENIR